MFSNFIAWIHSEMLTNVQPVLMYLGSRVSHSGAAPQFEAMDFFLCSRISKIHSMIMEMHKDLRVFILNLLIFLDFVVLSDLFTLICSTLYVMTNVRKNNFGIFGSQTIEKQFSRPQFMFCWSTRSWKNEFQQIYNEYS